MIAQEPSIGSWIFNYGVPAGLLILLIYGAVRTIPRMIEQARNDWQKERAEARQDRIEDRRDTLAALDRRDKIQEGHADVTRQLAQGVQQIASGQQQENATLQQVSSTMAEMARMLREIREDQRKRSKEPPR